MREQLPEQVLDPATQAEFLLLDQDLNERFSKAFEAIDNPCLAEVDHLSRFIREDGTWPTKVLEALEVNLLTAVKEAAMPHAVSTTHQEHIDGDFWWLDQTSRQVAESGYKFHKHPSARARVAVEIQEADDVKATLRPGFIKLIVSPKMSRSDAPYEVAKREHLADEDMIRIHALNCNEQGETMGKFMQSVLVRDIPLESWVKMFEDPNNIFGKAFALQDKQSALSIMSLHKELELPEAALPEGAISLIEAVLPYLPREERYKVESQLLLFRGNQVEIHKKAESIAARWLGFELELCKSLKQERATPEVQRFVYGLQQEWGDETISLLESLRLRDGSFAMTRQLAAQIEKAKQKTLWVSAAVITNNEKVLNQLDTETARHIYDNEMLIQQMMYEGTSYHDIIALETQNNQIVARQEVKVGGGCAGEGEADFGTSKSSPDESGPTDKTGNATSDLAAAKDEKKLWKWKSGVCRITQCPTRPRSTRVGPCEVCTCCQRIFDNGGNPSVVYSSKPEKSQATSEYDVSREAEALLEPAEVEKRASRTGSLALANA